MGPDPRFDVSGGGMAFEAVRTGGVLDPRTRCAFERPDCTIELCTFLRSKIRLSYEMKAVGVFAV